MMRKISTIGSTELAEQGTSQGACSGNKEPIQDFSPPLFILIPSAHPYRMAQLFGQLA